MTVMRMALSTLAVVGAAVEAQPAIAQKPSEGVVVTSVRPQTLSDRMALRVTSSSAAREGDAAKPTDTAWVVPRQFASEPNPVPATSEAIRRGRDLYLFECSECHGRTGRGDGPQAMSLPKRPGDLASPRVQAQTDGALLWKIQTGRGSMPKSAFGESDLWPVVVLIRSFATTKR